jgi:hypothetical protein
MNQSKATVRVEFVPSKHENTLVSQGFSQVGTRCEPVNIGVLPPDHFKPAIFGPNHPGL